MSNFFSNKWTKRVVALLGPVYTAFVVYFAYLSVYYNLVVLQPRQAVVLTSAVSLFALIVMLYTRETFITKLCSLILLPAMLLPLLMFFGQWGVLLPPLITALIIFFFSGIGETGKTIWGTIFLLLYLLGSLVYFVVTSMFAPSTVTTTVASGESPSGTYRFAVTETVDSSSGCTKVTVETTELDLVYDIARFEIKGLSKDVKIERPLNDSVTIEWQTENRQDITNQLNKISKNIEVTLSDAQMDMLDRDAYKVTFADGREMLLHQAEYHALTIPLDASDQEWFETDKTEWPVDDMGTKSLARFGITVEDFRTVTLSSLTDEDLATLGIPESGDVMYYNGECVFRYYIAILEQYFDISKQELGLT